MTIGKVHGTGGGNYDVDLAAHAHGEAETEHLYGGANAPKAQTGQLTAAQLRANLAIYGGSYHAGDKSPVSGQYIVIDSHGKKVGAEHSIKKGDAFPPTPGKDQHFKLLDPSRGMTPGGGVGGETFGMPGAKAEKSGQYVLVDSKGNQVGKGETTVAKGHTFPPTPKAGEKWKLVDSTNLARAGEKAEISGQYALVGSDGKFAGEITVNKGDKFPPTPHEGQGYRLIDATKHASGEKWTGETFLPNQKVGTSGQYELLNAKGEKTGQEVTLTKGKLFPPTPQKGEFYRLKDATKHG
ncbi:MAG TPA: hypothetical protein VHF22_01125 [Planctomycetota bacterium]|nr:hypothetical protein [Planctomycetota bacterium]